MDHNPIIDEEENSEGNTESTAQVWSTSNKSLAQEYDEKLE